MISARVYKVFQQGPIPGLLDHPKVMLLNMFDQVPQQGAIPQLFDHSKVMLLARIYKGLWGDDHIVFPFWGNSFFVISGLDNVPTRACKFPW